jgi:ABC-type glycerol-3-phosphate transport system substrate-binding protein
MAREDAGLASRTGGARGLTRRGALRWGVGAAVAGSLVGSLTTALPVKAAAAPITLVWRPWYNFPNGTGQAALTLMQHGIQPWLAKNPGVKVEITTLGYQGATIAAMLAGTGPDVFEDWVLPPYIENNLVYNFYPFVQQDNVNLNIFPSGEMQYFFDAARFAPGGHGGLYCLPAYIHTLAMAVNEGILDEMGLTYPEPDWTWEQWTHLWTTTTIRSKDPTKQRYGGNLYWSGYDYYGGNNPAPFYMKGFGGGYVDPNDATRSYIDQPGSIQCLEWAFNLMNEGVLGYGTFHTGHQVSAPRGTAGGLPYSAQAWQSVKWNFYAMPVWPKGRYTFAASDFYAISAATKRPDIAWSFLKFLCVDTAWQAFMMRLALNGPNQKDLYPEWQRVVGEVAPPLRTKNLDIIVQAVQNDEPYFGHTFQFADSQAGAIINKYTAMAQARQMTVPQAASEIAKQVNALEATGAVTQAKAYAALLQVEKLNQAKGTVQLPPPPVYSGDGNPPHLAPQYAVINKATGTYTLLGDGQDVWGDSDNCVYACTTTNSDQGEWICRVTALSNVNCPNLSPWTKVGLMARGDLGDAAAMVFFAVTGGNGIALQERPLSQGSPGGINGSTAKTGLIGAQYLTLNYMKPAPNYLIRPVWLKLVRSGTIWTGYTSIDGKTWALAGSTPVEMSSCWIGIFATAHNGDFNNKGYDRATFDHLSFTPTAVYQLGATGIPPAAGPVPANWATAVAK